MLQPGLHKNTSALLYGNSLHADTDSMQTQAIESHRLPCNAQLNWRGTYLKTTLGLQSLLHAVKQM